MADTTPSLTAEDYLASYTDPSILRGRPVEPITVEGYLGKSVIWETVMGRTEPVDADELFGESPLAGQDPLYTRSV